MNTLFLSTIKPAGESACYATIEQRRENKDAAEKPSFYVSYVLPEALASVINPTVAAFINAAYEAAVTKYARLALKEGKDSFTMPSLADLGKAKKREFSFTKDQCADWIKDYAFAILANALAAKSGFPADSVKVTKAILKYQATFLNLASTQIMQQVDIDACLRALEVLASHTVQHPYTDNVAERVAKKQSQLDAFLANGAAAEDDDLLDF